MNAKIYFLLLLSLLFFSSCATTPMPIAVIPQNGREASGALVAGNNGINLNLVYATKRKTIFNLSLQTKILTGLSNVYDLGLGQVSKSNKHLFMATFGYGRHRVDHITMGRYGARLTTFVDVFRASVYMNKRVHKNTYLVVRPSIFWGDGAHTSIGFPPSRRENFTTFALEPALFFRFGAKKKMFLGIGGFLPSEGLTYFEEDSSDFVPGLVWMSVGYRYGKKF